MALAGLALSQDRALDDIITADAAVFHDCEGGDSDPAAGKGRADGGKGRADGGGSIIS